MGRESSVNPKKGNIGFSQGKIIREKTTSLLTQNEEELKTMIIVNQK